MALTLQQIITEADIRMANTFDSSQKVSWLNEVNQEFFDVVKIPLITTATTSGIGSYILTPTDIRSKNIDKVLVGTRYHDSLQYGEMKPGRNSWDFNEGTKLLTLSPDTATGEKIIVRYYRIGTTTFVAGTLTAIPDAPAEYHQIYILGLAERIAKAMDDAAKANNFANDYRGALAVAQANYQR